MVILLKNVLLEAAENTENIYVMNVHYRFIDILLSTPWFHIFPSHSGSIGGRFLELPWRRLRVYEEGVGSWIMYVLCLLWKEHETYYIILYFKHTISPNLIIIQSSSYQPDHPALPAVGGQSLVLPQVRFCGRPIGGPDGDDVKDAQCCH